MKICSAMLRSSVNEHKQCNRTVKQSDLLFLLQPSRKRYKR